MGTQFFQHLKLLTDDGRNILMVMDGYRSHMSVRVLEMCHHINVIVYVLPFHTSGNAQPLDVTVLSVFKSSINEAVCNCVSGRRCEMERLLFMSIDHIFLRKSVHLGHNSVWVHAQWHLAT